MLPLGLYLEHRDELVQQSDGIKDEPLETNNLKLLANDAEARLIIHCALILLRSKAHIYILTLTQFMGYVIIVSATK